MKKIIPVIVSLAFSAAAIMLLMWVSSWHDFTIDKVEFSATPDEHRSIKLPFSENHIGTYWITIELQHVKKSVQQFRIIPDDKLIEIKLNGEAVPLDDIPLSARSDYGSGFVITFDNLIPEQTNKLEFEIVNESNPTGFQFKSVDRLSTTQLVAIFSIVLAYSLFLTRFLTISNIQKIFLVVSLLLSVIYLSKTDERTRTFDVYEGGGHRDYIEYLINNHAFPNPGDGWEYHQPQLYYIIAAVVKQTAHIAQTANDMWAQLLALFFWSIFLVSSLASLKIALTKQQTSLLIASFALCLWPSGIIHSIRIGNDLALYAFYGLTFFYTLKWWRSRHSSHLFWASVWMAASILTKSNGLAAAATLGLLFVYHLYMVARKPERLTLQKQKITRDIAAISGLFILAMILNFGDNVYFYLHGTANDWLLSNVGTTINSGLKVNNNSENYLIFDLATFLKYPFISTWEDIYGRQYFWNFLWRSALSSEFFFNGKFMPLWGFLNGIFLLLAISSVVIYFLQKQPVTSISRVKHSLYKHLPWIMAFIFPLILLLAYRIKVPLSCNTDFRYIYPIILSMLFFATLVWREPKKFPIPAFLSISIVLIGINSFFWMFYLN